MVSHHFYILVIFIDVTLNMPILQNVSSSFTIDAIQAERLGLPSWLIELPVISWSDMKVVTKHGQSRSFQEWFSDILEILNTIAKALSVSKEIRTYARHLRDYINLQQCALEGYWLKAQQESPKSCGSHNSTTSTPSGTDSLYINNKRKYHENFDTPESIKRHVLDIKSTLKLKEIEQGTKLLKNIWIN